MQDTPPGLTAFLVVPEASPCSPKSSQQQGWVRSVCLTRSLMPSVLTVLRASGPSMHLQDAKQICELGVVWSTLCYHSVLLTRSLNLHEHSSESLVSVLQAVASLNV